MVEPIVEQKPKSFKKYLVIFAAVACGALGVYLGVIDQETAMCMVQNAFGM